MSLNNKENVIRYLINGNTDYTIPFIYWAKEDIKAKVINAEGVEVQLVYGTDYSVSSPMSSGGILYKITDWSSFSQITIYRELSYTQEVDFTEGSTLSAETIETTFDKDVARSSQLEEKMTRSIVSPISEEGSNLELPLKNKRKDKLVGFDETGENIIPIDGANIPVISEQVTEDKEITLQAREDAILASKAAKRAFKADIGDAQHNEFTILHNLDTYDYLVNVWQNIEDRESVTFTAKKIDKNNLTLIFDDVPGVNEYTAVITCVEASMYGVTDWADVVNKPELYNKEEIDSAFNDSEHPEFTENTELENIISKESNGILWGKVKKAISSLINHILNTSNPHSVSKEQVTGLKTTDSPTFATVNTGQGDNELYGMNQDVKTNSDVKFNTINTGQGNNKLYAMNQNVRTTDSPTFAGTTINGLAFNGISHQSWDKTTVHGTVTNQIDDMKVGELKFVGGRFTNTGTSEYYETTFQIKLPATGTYKTYTDSYLTHSAGSFLFNETFYSNSHVYSTILIRIS